LPKKVAEVLVESGFSQETVSKILPGLLAGIQGGSAEAILAIPGMTTKILMAVEHGAKTAYADSFRFIWYSIIPFAVVSVGISLFLKSTKDQMTNVVAAGVKRKH
jgi:hypothetical protein